MTTTTNTTATKMTYAKALSEAIACEVLSSEVREKLEALLAQQVKKSSTEKKPTKVQLANAGVKETIVEVLREAGKPMTISELMTANEALSPMVVSTQKVSALLTQMVKAGTVNREEIKRKAYFSLA